MTNLEKHILKLLLNNDCVIVPGLGGFIAHHIPASYDEGSRMFTPPTRMIGFNSKLVMNDSVLAQEYATCYDLSYPEALKRIEYEAEEFERIVEHAEGGYEICGLGRIYILEDGRFDFLPNSSGLTTPELYGFATFEMETRKDEQDAAYETISSQATQSSDTPQSVTIHHIENTPGDEISMPGHNGGDEEERRLSVSIPVKLLHQIAAACIALVILVSFPSRLGDASTSNIKKSSLNTGWLYEIMPKEITTGKPSCLESAPNQDKESTDNTATEYEHEQRQKVFTIVLASRVTKANAKAYAQDLQEDGMKDTYVYTTPKGMTMVVYKTFDSKAEAVAELNNINADPNFSSCWITEIYNTQIK